jgi:hypothetical protein
VRFLLELIDAQGGRATCFEDKTTTQVNKLVEVGERVG